VYAVSLYCFSGAALLFAWRATMPTFTDASLIAGAAGLLLGVLLRRDDPSPLRFALGALAFLALEGAVFIRYSDVIVLIVALVAVVGLAQVCRVTWASVAGWVGTVAAFAVFDLAVNRFLYGGLFTTGYRPGIVTFAGSAVAPNLERMPARLVESVPTGIFALLALAWIAGRFFSRTGSQPLARGTVRRDALVALALGVGWLAMWGLYSTYTWTVGQTLGPGNPIHVVRFYVPVLGLMALLGAWLLARLPRWAATALIAVIVGLALWSYVTPANDTVVARPNPAPLSSALRVTAPTVVSWLRQSPTSDQPAIR
jgi:hypothetical protein